MSEVRNGRIITDQMAWFLSKASYTGNKFCIHNVDLNKACGACDEEAPNQLTRITSFTIEIDGRPLGKDEPPEQFDARNQDVHDELAITINELVELMNASEPFLSNGYKAVLR